MVSNHINYPDFQGNVYCRKDNVIMNMDKSGKFWSKCVKCPMFAGTYQGEGIECTWDDPDAKSYIQYSDDAKSEFIRMGGHHNVTESNV